MPVTLTCPSCGNQINQLTRSPQVVVCPACNTTNLLVSGSLEQVGKLAVLTETPSIFTLHRRYKHKDWEFTPVGRVRYDYGQGYWDEWFVRDSGGKENWVSVDEGDIAIERLYAKEVKLPDFAQIEVGNKLTVGKLKLLVTEKNTCTMIGAEGELPFKLIPDETYDYIDLLGPDRTSFSVEYQDDGIECYKGYWIDPFDIKEA